MIPRFLNGLQRLMKAAYEERADEIRGLVEEVVPTYHPAGRHGTEFKGETFQKQMQQVMEKAEESKD